MLLHGEHLWLYRSGKEYNDNHTMTKQSLLTPLPKPVLRDWLQVKISRSPHRIIYDIISVPFHTH